MQRLIRKVNLNMDSLKSPSTQTTYKYHQEQFLATKPDPKTLDDISLTEHIEGYLGGMLESGLHYTYRNQAYQALKHYYSIRPNKKLLDWGEIKSCLGEIDNTGKKKGYKVED